MKEKIIKIIPLSIVLVLLISGMQTASALSNSGGKDWSYFKEVTIKEKSGIDLRDYQILLELDSTNFPSNVNSDGSDLRFVKNEKELSYWIEDFNPVKKTAKIWVKVPLIPENGSAKIKMYYGNPSAISMSDPKKTFDYWESFEDGVLGDWNGTTGGGGIDSKRAYEGDYSMYVQDLGGSSGGLGGEGAMWSPDLSPSLIRDKKLEFSYQLETWVNDADNHGEGGFITLIAYDSEGIVLWEVNYLLYWDDDDGPYRGYHTEFGEYKGIWAPEGFSDLYFCNKRDDNNCEPEALNKWHYHSRSIPEDMPIGAKPELWKVDHFRIEMGASGRDSRGVDTKYFVDFIKTRKYAPIEPTLTISKEYLAFSDPLTITKTATPSSINQGEETTIRITIENVGTTTLEDIQIFDIPSTDFEFIEGETSANYLNIKPGESRTFQYKIESKEQGKFELDQAIATYADSKGQHSTAKSNMPIVEVLPPSSEEETPGFGAVFAITGLLAVAYLIRRRAR